MTVGNLHRLKSVSAKLTWVFIIVLILAAVLLLRFSFTSQYDMGAGEVRMLAVIFMIIVAGCLSPFILISSACWNYAVKKLDIAVPKKEMIFYRFCLVISSVFFVFFLVILTLIVLNSFRNA